MLIFPGSQALSDFRCAALLERLRAVVPGVEGLQSQYVHWLDCASIDQAADKAKLNHLLDYQPFISSNAAYTTDLYVVPRLGTISPWSSKATDILHNCGLGVVKRVERGIFIKSNPPQR